MKAINFRYTTDCYRANGWSESPVTGIREITMAVRACAKGEPPPSAIHACGCSSLTAGRSVPLRMLSASARLSFLFEFVLIHACCKEELACH